METWYTKLSFQKCASIPFSQGLSEGLPKNPQAAIALFHLQQGIRFVYDKVGHLAILTQSTQGIVLLRSHLS